ncbi:MAG: hypothetical protein AB7O77_09900 [Phycisphaerales bacterium]
MSMIADTGPFRFPEQPKPALANASLLQKWKLRFRERFGKTLTGIGVPGAVAPFDHTDPATKQTIRVSVGPLFTRLSVNERDYYFDRLTGKFDGTGSAV